MPEAISCCNINPWASRSSNVRMPIITPTRIWGRMARRIRVAVKRVRRVVNIFIRRR